MFNEIEFRMITFLSSGASTRLGATNFYLGFFSLRSFFYFRFTMYACKELLRRDEEKAFSHLQ